jgi:Uncharacterized conserved protein (DUF2196)
VLVFGRLDAYVSATRLRLLDGDPGWGQRLTTALSVDEKLALLDERVRLLAPTGPFHAGTSDPLARVAELRAQGTCAAQMVAAVLDPALAEAGVLCELIYHLTSLMEDLQAFFAWEPSLQSETILFGSPARVCEQMARVLEVSGCHDVIGAFAWGTLSHDQTQRSLCLFAEEVMPAFSGRFTGSIVKDVLTTSARHPHGIKVRLDTGEVGCVQEIVEAGTDAATERKGPDMLP